MDLVTLYAPDGSGAVDVSSPREATNLRAAGYRDTPPTAITVETPDDRVVFDPSQHTVEQVQAFISEHPEFTEQVLDAERAGKNRAGLIGA